MTLANKITLGRFAITIVYFVLLGICGREADWRLLYAAFFLFLLAVVGDGLDGYYARKYHQETTFGRIADPFVDKIMICGSFVFFLSIRPLAEILTGWMVMIIIAREFLVSAIRSVRSRSRRATSGCAASRRRRPGVASRASPWMSQSSRTCVAAPQAGRPSRRCRASCVAARRDRSKTARPIGPAAVALPVRVTWPI